jgi:hypothetical protein
MKFLRASIRAITSLPLLVVFVLMCVIETRRAHKKRRRAREAARSFTRSVDYGRPHLPTKKKD